MIGWTGLRRYTLQWTAVLVLLLAYRLGPTDSFSYREYICAFNIIAAE